MTQICRITRFYVGLYLAKKHIREYLLKLNQAELSFVWYFNFHVRFERTAVVQIKTYNAYTAQHWGRCSCLFDSGPLFYIYTMALPVCPVRPNGTEESTCLSRAYCISLCCLSSYLSLPLLYSPSICTAINPSLHPSIFNTWFGWELCTSLHCCLFQRLRALPNCMH